MQVSGEVDQTSGMLSEEVKEKGYALLCISYPQSDCSIKIIDEVSLEPAKKPCTLQAPGAWLLAKLS